jgi:hypothetical protein
MSRMKDLLGDEPYRLPQPPARDAFDGESYEPSRDYERMSGQLLRVFDLMKDGQWRTLEGIASQVSGSVAAISARLRDFRKAKFGSHTVERKNIEGGLFVYRLVLNTAIKRGGEYAGNH